MQSPTWKAEVLLAGSWRGATSVLISNGRHHLVVDTGLPHEAHQLLRELEKRGLKPADIGTVVNTHFHVDHVLNNSLFPGSCIYATQESYEWCRSLYADLKDNANWEKLALKYYPETVEYASAKEKMAGLRKFALRWWDPARLGSPGQFRWIERQPLADGLESVITDGHVPGHISILVDTEDSGEAPLTVIAGDALLSRDDEQNVLTMIPRNRAEYASDRAGILSLRGLILPGHGAEFLNTVTSEE